MKPSDHFHQAEPDSWKKKATAFVVRAHRHLWGKNNEDLLAYLFLAGLTNDFAKKMMLGWNKFGQERPADAWGLVPEKSNASAKLFLPAGIVAPYIVNKQLKSVFIHPTENSHAVPCLVPGSETATLVYNGGKKSAAYITNLFDGLFLLQEAGENTCIVIDPTAAAVPSAGGISTRAWDAMQQAGTLKVFCRNNDQKAWLEKNFSAFPNTRFMVYSAAGDLKNLL